MVYGIVHPLTPYSVSESGGAHGNATRPGRGAAQALRPGRRPRRLRPGRARGHGLRPARPQRRRQDHRRADPGHPAAARRRPGPGRRLRRASARPTRSATASGCSASTPPSTRSSAAGRTWCCSAGSTTWARPAPAAGADELLERFGLAETGAKPVKQYSGGMRRRLDLAASLILAPPVLFLDEPTTGLDPRGRNEVWEAVRALVAGGTTVLLTTQYLDEADQLADRISVIDHGRVIADGHARPAQVEARRRPDRRRRSAGRPARRHRGHRRPAGRRPSPRSTPTPAGSARRSRDRVAALTGIGPGARRDAGIAVEDIALRRPTLDEVFLHLTGHRHRAGRRAAPGGDGMTVPTVPTPPMPETPRPAAALVAGRRLDRDRPRPGPLGPPAGHAGPEPALPGDGGPDVRLPVRRRHDGAGRRRATGSS